MTTMELEEIAPEFDAEAVLAGAPEGEVSTISATLTSTLERAIPLAVDALVSLALHEPDGRTRLAACREVLRLGMALGVVPVDDGGSLERFMREVVVLDG